MSFDEASAAIPEGNLRRRAISAGKQLSRGIPWNAAVKEVDNSSLSGKSLLICLNLYGMEQSEPYERVINFFAQGLSGHAAACRQRIKFIRKSGLMLLITMLMHSAVSLYCISYLITPEICDCVP